MALELDRSTRELPGSADPHASADRLRPPPAAREPVAARRRRRFGRSDRRRRGDRAARRTVSLAARRRRRFASALSGPSGSGKSFALAAAGRSDRGARRGVRRGVRQPRCFAEWSSRDSTRRACRGDSRERAGFGGFRRPGAGSRRGELRCARRRGRACDHRSAPRRGGRRRAPRRSQPPARGRARRARRSRSPSARACAEALLYETPGSRVDTMIRASRATIEARLAPFRARRRRRGGQLPRLVRDLSAPRRGLALRAGAARDLGLSRTEGAVAADRRRGGSRGDSARRLRAASAEGLLGSLGRRSRPPSTPSQRTSIGAKRGRSDSS